MGPSVPRSPEIPGSLPEAMTQTAGSETQHMAGTPLIQRHNEPAYSTDMRDHRGQCVAHSPACTLTLHFDSSTYLRLLQYLIHLLTYMLTHASTHLYACRYSRALSVSCSHSCLMAHLLACQPPQHHEKQHMELAPITNAKHTDHPHPPPPPPTHARTHSLGFRQAFHISCPAHTVIMICDDL